MKYLYVLSSDISDYYLEQAFLSMTSLRIQMPESYISLLIDNNTEKSLTGNRKNILNLVNELKSIKIDNRYNKKASSRWLKTSMRVLIENDFLFIDGDTIIVNNLYDLEKEENSVGAVLNEHTILSDLADYNPVYLSEMQTLDKKLGFSSTIKSKKYFNSGVLFCKDNAAGYDFFNEWHRLWLYCFENGVITDQQSFNQANYMLGDVISELGGEWNCQILADGGIRYLHSAKLIHYFANMKEENPYIISSKNILEDIKSTGTINQNINNMLTNPKNLFKPNVRLRVVDKSTRKFNKSITYAVIQYIFHSKIGSAIELLLLFIYKRIIKPFRKTS